MKLIDNWRDAWKFYSTHALIITGSIPLAWAKVPDAWKDAFPPEIKPYVPVILAVASVIGGIVGRVVKQAAPDETE